MASWRLCREAGADVVGRIRLRMDPEQLWYGTLCDHDSLVHTAGGDVHTPESRSSRSAVGDDDAIFQLLQACKRFSPAASKTCGAIMTSCTTEKAGASSGARTSVR